MSLAEELAKMELREPNYGKEMNEVDKQRLIESRKKKNGEMDE